MKKVRFQGILEEVASLNFLTDNQKKTLPKSLKEYYKTFKIIMNNWLLKILSCTDSIKINRQGHYIRMYWTNFSKSMSNQNSCFDNFKRFIRFVKDSWLKVRFQGIIKEVARLNFSTANQKKPNFQKHANPVHLFHYWCTLLYTLNIL